MGSFFSQKESLQQAPKKNHRKNRTTKTNTNGNKPNQPGPQMMAEMEIRFRLYIYNQTNQSNQTKPKPDSTIYIRTAQTGSQTRPNQPKHQTRFRLSETRTRKPDQTRQQTHAKPKAYPPGQLKSGSENTQAGGVVRGLPHLQTQNTLPKPTHNPTQTHA